MTSDGISTKDWDRVKERVAKIATAVCSDKSAQAKKETKALLVLLDQLQKRYGEIPSILATRADYVTGATKSLRRSLSSMWWIGAIRRTASSGLPS